MSIEQQATVSGRPIVDPPAFVAGLALGIVIGVRLVESRALQPTPRAGDLKPLVPAPPGAPLWRERVDTFAPASEVALPVDAALWRTQGGSLVAIPPSVRGAMESHVRADLRHERVGLLAGRVGASQAGRPQVTVVERAIPLRSSDASATHVVLTTESVADIGAALRDQEPGSTIVGWFHSHPNLGVFLSGTDMRTQRACFAADWQTAVVLDPVRGLTGVFAGAEGARAEPIRQDQGTRA